MWTPGTCCGHAAERLGAAQRADADDDGAALVQAARAQLAHEIGQHRHVEAELGLDELRAGIDLSFQIADAVAERRHEGIGGGAEKQIWRNVELAARGKSAAIAHVLGNAQQ